MASKSGPETLQQAILFLSDYENCKKAVEVIRWPDGVVKCPTCGSDSVTYLAKQRRWKCYEQHPRAQFSLKVETLFEDSPVGLEKWLPALWLITTCKSGMSSYELARALGVTQKTAWFMLRVCVSRCKVRAAASSPVRSRLIKPSLVARPATCTRASCAART